MREIMQRTRQVNEDLKLGIVDLDIEGSCRFARGQDGRIVIDKFLKELAKKHNR